MPRVALQDSLQLCRISGCLYTSFDQDHDFAKINVTLPRFIVDNLFMRCTIQDPTRYPRILDIDDLRPL
jgi:hypothetical protein